LLGCFNFSASMSEDDDYFQGRPSSYSTIDQ
jgi:hypothetical protein